MYRKHKIIKLRTSKISEGQAIFNDGKSEEIALTTCNKIIEQIKEYDFCYYNLYIISDEKIEVGDWYVRSNEIKKCLETRNDPRAGDIIIYKTENDKSSYDYRKYCTKVIATTDTTLNLPLISKEFVENYCKNQVKEVMVEYYPEVPLDDESKINIEESVVLSNNKYISLKPTKDSWSKEEVRELLYKLTNNYVESTDPIQLGKWIENQLK